MTTPEVSALFVQLGVPGLLALVLWLQLRACSDERRQASDQFTATLIKHYEVGTEVSKLTAESNVKIATAFSDLASAVRESTHGAETRQSQILEVLRTEATLHTERKPLP